MIPSSNKPVATGIEGLDRVLGGGYADGQMHIVEGMPGAGKSTLGLQFLAEAKKRGETGLFVTLSETADEIRATADSHGLDIAGIDIFELMPPEFSVDQNREQTVFHSSDVELAETVRIVIDAITSVNPSCVVFDSISEIRLLAQLSLRFRRQALALKHFFLRAKITTLLLDDLADEGGLQIHSLAHGVITLERTLMSYGAERRRLMVSKLRGRKYVAGYHDFAIEGGGLRVFPRLVAANEAGVDFDGPSAVSDNTGLDSLLGGGLDRGTTTLFQGPAGSGKSSIALQFMIAAVRRGERCLLLSFDEIESTFRRRANSLGLDAADPLARDILMFRQINPAELSSGELAEIVRQAVQDGVRFVVLDSLNGYLQSMVDERNLQVHLHELLTHLNQQGVCSILTLAQSDTVGSPRSPFDATYLVDTVLLLRFFEFEGELRRAVSVVKKRTGQHERTIRELSLTSNGVRIGEPLRSFRGVLAGTPDMVEERHAP